MNKRNVGIFNQVAGDPVHAILKQWTAHVEKDPEMQPLLYSNLAMACDDSLIPRLEKARSTSDNRIMTLIGFDLATGVLRDLWVLYNWLSCCYSLGFHVLSNWGATLRDQLCLYRLVIVSLNNRKSRY